MSQSAQTIAEMIRHRLDQLTPTERKAALVLLGNYPVPGLQTVAQFAQQAAVSNPTVLRLIAKLGFTAYADFQRRLRGELEARLRSPLTKEVPTTPAAQGESGEFLPTYWRSVMAAMESSLRELNISEFEGAVSLLADTRRPVMILGGRLSSSLAEQLYLHLRELRADVALIRGQTASWAEQLLDVTAAHTLVVFDIRRYQEDVIRFGQEAVRRGARLILITDEWLSPLAAVARQVLAVRTAVNSHWDSFAPISAVIEALIAQLSSNRWPEVKQRIEELEAIRRDVAL
jgi:DNA-binding MurR/RpiR family transcriptional regulator